LATHAAAPLGVAEAVAFAGAQADADEAVGVGRALGKPTLPGPPCGGQIGLAVGQGPNAEATPAEAKSERIEGESIFAQN